MTMTMGSGTPRSGITSGWLAAAPFEERTVGRVLGRAAAARPDEVLFLLERRRYTLREVDAQVDMLARNLHAAGVGPPGTRVALLMATSPGTSTDGWPLRSSARSRCRSTPPTAASCSATSWTR